MLKTSSAAFLKAGLSMGSRAIGFPGVVKGEAAAKKHVRLFERIQKRPGFSKGPCRHDRLFQDHRNLLSCFFL